MKELGYELIYVIDKGEDDNSLRGVKLFVSNHFYRSYIFSIMKFHKKLIVISSGLLSISTFSFSQNELAIDSCDILVTKNNTTLYVRIIELTYTEIFYKNCLSDSSGNSGQWIKRNELQEITIRNQEFSRRLKEGKFQVQPALAEIGVSFNLIPSWYVFNLGGEIRLRIVEAEKNRHFIYPRFAYRKYETASKPYTTHATCNTSLGYHAEIKKGSTRWRFSYGGAMEFYYLIEDQSKYTSPYGSVSPASRHAYYKFGLVARVGVQYYLSNYCHIQLNVSGGIGSPIYEFDKIHSSHWFSFVSTQLPAISLFGRIPAR